MIRPRVDPDAGLLQAEARGADTAAGGEQQRVRAQLPAIAQLYGQVVAVPAHGDHPGPEDHPGMQPASGGVRVTGSLTVRGRTRPLPFDAKVSAAASEVRLDAEVPVNRADFGMTYSPMRMASLNNTITVHAVFTRQ
jgi:YceI-like domain